VGDPSFTQSGGIIALAGVPRNGLASGTGTAAVARNKDGSGAIIIDGLTVGTIGCDIAINSVALEAGQAVAVHSASFTHG
jgi:hypothetical protein